MNNFSRLSLFAVPATLAACFAFYSLAQGQLKTVAPQLRPPIRSSLEGVPLTVGPVSHIQAGRIVTLPTSQMATNAAVYTVPRGYRLAIDYVTFTITAQVRDDVAVARLRIGATLNGSLVWHDVLTLGGSRLWLGDSKTVKLYADPGSTIHAIVEREFRPPSSARISIVGTLEPVGTATGPKIG